MSWCIYKHTSPTGLCYIGKAKGNPKTRWGKNGKNYIESTMKNNKFSVAITLWGWDNLSHEILEDNISTNEEAREREKYWVNYYNSCHCGYNTQLTKTQWFFVFFNNGFPSALSARSWCSSGEEFDNWIREEFDIMVSNLLNNYLGAIDPVFYTPIKEFLSFSYQICADKAKTRMVVRDGTLVKEEREYSKEFHYKLRKNILDRIKEIYNWIQKYERKEFIWQKEN